VTDPKNVPVITKTVRITNFQLILAKSLMSFPNEIPAKAPSAVVGAKKATFDVVPITNSLTGEIGEANIKPNKETYIIAGNFINRLFILLIVKPVIPIIAKTPSANTDSLIGMLYSNTFVRLIIVESHTSKAACSEIIFFIT